MRKDTIIERGHSMIEETMGEVLSIMSEVCLVLISIQIEKRSQK